MSDQAVPRATPRARWPLALGLVMAVLLGAFVAGAPFLWGAIGPAGRGLCPWPELLIPLGLLAALAVPGVLLVGDRARITTAGACSVYIVLAAFCQQGEGLTLAGLDAYEWMLVCMVPLLVLGLLGRNSFTFHRSHLNLLLLVAGALYILSATKDLSFSGLRMKIKPLITYLLLFQCVTYVRGTSLYMRAFVIVAVANMAFAMFQLLYWAFTGDFFLIDMDVMGVKYITADTAFGIPLIRAPGFAPHYTALSLVEGLAFCYCLSQVLFGAGWQSRRSYVLFWVAMLLTGAGLLFTQSNSAMMGAGAGAVALVIWRFRKFLLHGVALGSLMAAVGLALIAVFKHEPTVVPELKTMVMAAKDSQQERFNLNRQGIHGFLKGEQWLLGRGVGNAGKYCTNVRRWSAHNGYIVVADEMGIIGLLLSLTIYAWILVRIVQLNVLVRDGPEAALVRSFVAIYLLIYVRELFEDNYLEGLELAFFAMVEATWLVLRGGGGWNPKPIVAAASLSTAGTTVRLEGT